MTKLLKIPALLLLLTSAALGQYVTVSASQIHDSGGNLLAGGTIAFQAVDANGNPIAYQAGGGGSVINWPLVFTITNGAFTGTLANSALTNPVNVCFAVTVKNTQNQILIGGNPNSGYQCVQTNTTNFWCSASACNFDQYFPQANGIPVVPLPPPTSLSLGGLYLLSCTPPKLVSGVDANGRIICTNAGSGTGDVNGPGSSVAGNLAAFADTSGILLQDSGLATANIVQQTSNGAANQVCTYTGANKICVPGAVSNAALQNSTLGVGGTVNQIVSSVGTPALGGATVLSIANPFVFPGKATTIASNAGSAGFNLPSGTAPSSPASGDFWNANGTLQLFDGTHINSFTTVQGAVGVGNCPVFATTGGLLSDSGSPCGNAFVIKTNTVNNSSQSLLNFTSPSAFNGLTIAFQNTSGGIETLAISGTLGNAGLTNSATTVNGQSCVLGSSCTVPFSVGGVSNTSQAGINFVNPATFNGLSFTYSNPSTNNLTFAVAGTLNNAGLTNSGVSVNGQSCVLGATCNVPFSVNGTPNSSLAGLNFTNPAGFNGLTFTYSNPATTGITFAVGGTLNNAGLTNSATTVNGQNCVLGAACNLPFQNNSSGNASNAGLNFVTSTANTVGLTITPSNPGTNQEKFEVTGGAYTGNAATATALASTPTQCSGLQFATGVAASGNANCSGPRVYTASLSGTTWSIPAATHGMGTTVLVSTFDSSGNTVAGNVAVDGSGNVTVSWLMSQSGKVVIVP